MPVTEHLTEKLDTAYEPDARRLCDSEVEDMLLHIRDRALLRVVKGIDDRDPLEIIELIQKIMDKSCDQLAKQYVYEKDSKTLFVQSC